MTTVLLVEDERGLAQAIQQELEVHGFQVMGAVDGLAALKLSEQRQPDLIILDWMVAALDGLEALRRLRRVLKAPVLMLVSHNEEANRVIGLELGVDDTLVKPFSMQELVMRVQTLLRRFERLREVLSQDREEDSLPITYRDLTLIAENRLVMAEGESAELTPIEFRLLHLLLRNPGRVFSRAYLLETVWEGDNPDGERAVDQVVSRLRKKLGERENMIETVWGKGYRMGKVVDEA